MPSSYCEANTKDSDTITTRCAAIVVTATEGTGSKMHHTTEVLFSGLGIIGFLIAAGDSTAEISSKAMADSMVLAWCLAGSFSATLIYALALYVPGPDKPRGIWPEACANFMFGYLFGPLLTLWLAPKLGLEVSLNTCLGLSGAVSLGGTVTLKKLGGKILDKCQELVDSVDFLSWIKTYIKLKTGFTSTNEIVEKRKEQNVESVKTLVAEVKRRDSDIIDPNDPNALDQPTGL